MRKVCTLALLLVSTHAFAQAPEKEAAKPAEAPPAAGADMMAPPAELQQLKDMVGVWKCQGKFSMGGKEMQDKSKIAWSWDLDKHFLAGTMTSEKSKENPDGFKGKMFVGYDPGSKMFQMVSLDSMGAVSMGQSKGWEGDSLKWTNKIKVMGMAMDGSETITRKGPREVTVSGQAGSGPQAMTWETTCKK
jgi:hypothetical protein